MQNAPNEQEKAPFCVGARNGADEKARTGETSSRPYQRAAWNKVNLEQVGPPTPPPQGGASEPPCLKVTTQSAESEKASSWADELELKLRKLSGSAKKTAFALQRNAERLVEHVWGLNNTAMVTLTFGGGGAGPSVKKAEECFNSFRTNALADKFPGGIKVLERGAKKGRVHFHLLIDCGRDIRSGVDLEAMKRGDRRTFGPYLRHLNAWIRDAGKKYGFGRIVECDPIVSTSEGVSKYVCKYISKHINQREKRDKGARMKSYFGNAKAQREVVNSNIAFASKGAWCFRAKFAAVAKLNGFADMEDFARAHGPRYMNSLGGYIMEYPLGFYPSKAHAFADGIPEWRLADLPDDAMDIKLVRARRFVDVDVYGKRFKFAVLAEDLEYGPAGYNAPNLAAKIEARAEPSQRQFTFADGSR